MNYSTFSFACESMRTVLNDPTMDNMKCGESFGRKGTRHIYIRRLNQRFGFVRYRGISNPQALEKKLDNIQIDNMKIHVNKPKYQRYVDASRKEGGQRSENMVSRTIYPQPIRKRK